MRIRSITCFCNPGYPLEPGVLDRVRALVASAQEALTSAGYEVQTARLATPAFPHLLPDLRPQTAIGYAQARVVRAYLDRRDGVG